jgi:hypothetical protein
MDMMKKDMHKGSSFNKSHKKAMKKVGKWEYIIVINAQEEPKYLRIL